MLRDNLLKGKKTRSGGGSAIAYAILDKLGVKELAVTGDSYVGVTQVDSGTVNLLAGMVGIEVAFGQEVTSSIGVNIAVDKQRAICAKLGIVPAVFGRELFLVCLDKYEALTATKK